MTFLGLEAQLLGIVVRKERPELEEQKDKLVVNIAAGKKKLQELEDEILRFKNIIVGKKLKQKENKLYILKKKMIETIVQFFCSHF